jgi:diguanylate cyclase (GGDEF)-like protein
MTKTETAKMPGYLRKLSERTPGGVFIWRDGTDEILYANQDFLQMMECENFSDFQQWAEGHFENILDPGERESIHWAVNDWSLSCRQKIEEEESGYPDSLRLTYRIRTKNGKERTINHVSHHVIDPQWGMVSYAIVLPAEGKQKYNEADKLTGLPGVRQFLAHADQAMNRMRRKGKKSYLVYFNLVGFRKYNDKMGLQKGDQVLQQMGRVLHDCFTRHMVARYGSDHFLVFYTGDDLSRRIERVDKKLRPVLGEKLTVKAGVYEIAPEDSISASAACDFAKTACRSISHDTHRMMQIYNQKIGQEVLKKEYITDTIDTAVRKGYIQVYYQPLVRSVSHSLCGLEALSRWIDPVYGFLSPADFIQVLEDNRQIYKLDSYVIGEICKKLREEMDRGNATVPVSFNLSRYDFELCPIFDIVEKAVTTYRIPRDMIHIEITESTMVHDRKRMIKEVDRFRQAGYQVWMDDFGSGYSSLNVLKDYHFDEIKIDMEFLRRFTKVSQEIVASTVRMAKHIHTHTLAEGVETSEHVDFLKKIGCEKMQGYYFGKPAPYDETMKNCREQGLETDPDTMRNYYRSIGMIDVQTEKPVAVMECSTGKETDTFTTMRILFANDSCQKLVRAIGYASAEQVSHLMEGKDSIARTRVLHFINQFDWEKDLDRPHIMDIMLRGHYVKAQFKSIARMNDRRAFLITLNDVTQDANHKLSKELDILMRHIFMAYDNLWLIYVNKDYMETWHQDFYFKEIPGTRYNHVRQQMETYAKRMIHPMDYERYMSFINLDTMEQRIRSAPDKLLIGQFRTRDVKGGYTWKVHNCSVVLSGKEQILLYAIKPSVIESDERIHQIYNEYFHS